MRREEQLELAAQQARTALGEWRAHLDRAEIAADMANFLHVSDIAESKAFLCTFVKRIVVEPGRATIHYTTPMPEDSPMVPKKLRK